MAQRENQQKHNPKTKWTKPVTRGSTAHACCDWKNRKLLAQTTTKDRDRLQSGQQPYDDKRKPATEIATFDAKQAKTNTQQRNRTFRTPKRHTTSSVVWTKVRHSENGKKVKPSNSEEMMKRLKWKSWRMYARNHSIKSEKANKPKSWSQQVQERQTKRTKLSTSRQRVSKSTKNKKKRVNYKQQCNKNEECQWSLQHEKEIKNKKRRQWSRKRGSKRAQERVGEKKQ